MITRRSALTSPSPSATPRRGSPQTRSSATTSCTRRRMEDRRYQGLERWRSMVDPQHAVRRQEEL